MRVFLSVTTINITHVYFNIVSMDDVVSKLNETQHFL